MTPKHYFFGIVTLALATSSCENTPKQVGMSPPPPKVEHSEHAKSRTISDEFKAYWYNGTAEVTSYELSQERYGSLREGTAVTIFVTEDFAPDKQVKADNRSEDNIPVLKFNSTKKFLTGIYPYSIMNSTFSPVDTDEHAIKVSNSVQEWCGQVYMQLNNREKYEIVGYSYFESEGDQEKQLPKSWLEDEIWNRIRINPNELPTGDFMMIPSFESMRLRHKEAKAYPVTASLRQGDSLSIYQLKYPELSRDLVIYFNSDFPFEIEKWEETNAGWGNSEEKLKTTATRLGRIRSAYWTKNKPGDIILRDSLGLNP